MYRSFLMQFASVYAAYGCGKKKVSPIPKRLYTVTPEIFDAFPHLKGILKAHNDKF